MTSIANGSVSIQSTSESVPSTPSWFGEVVLMAAYRRRARRPQEDQRACILCATTFRARRRDRFSRGSLRSSFHGLV